MAADGGGGSRAGCSLCGAQELLAGPQHPQGWVSPGLIPRTAGSIAPGLAQRTFLVSSLQCWKPASPSLGPKLLPGVSRLSPGWSESWGAPSPHTAQTLGEGFVWGRL